MEGLPLDIKEYFRIFRRFWWIILLVTVSSAAVSGTQRAFQRSTSICRRSFRTITCPPRRCSWRRRTARRSPRRTRTTCSPQERVVSYAALATSEQVAARAIDQLKAPLSVGELRSKVTAMPQPKTVLLDISVKDADPAQAQTYANAVADSLVGLVAELETSRRGGSPAAGAIVVDDANYPTDPGGLGLVTRIGLGAVAGLLLGLLIAVHPRRRGQAAEGTRDRRVRQRRRGARRSARRLVARPTATVADLDAGGLYAERIRELRTNLRFATSINGGGQARVIAVTSPSARRGPHDRGHRPRRGDRRDGPLGRRGGRQPAQRRADRAPAAERQPPQGRHRARPEHRARRRARRVATG